MTTVTLIATFSSLVLTLGVLWVNPYRFSNQVFGLVTGIQTLALACVYRAKMIAEIRPPDYIEQFENLLRANAATIAFLPTSLWLLKNAILLPANRRLALIRSIPLLILSIITALVCYSNFFIYDDHTGFIRRGPAYYCYSLLALAVYSTCLFQVWNEIRDSSGIRRVELQFLVLNIGGAALLLAALNAAGNYFELPTLKSAGVLIIFFASALTALALLFHRVFNARELLLQLGHRLFNISILIICVYFLWNFSNDYLDEPFSILLAVGLLCPIAFWLEQRSRHWFERNSLKKLELFRDRTLEIASCEFESNNLIQKFEELVRCQCQTLRGSLLFDHDDSFSGGDITISKTSPALRALFEFGWATPESLNRRKNNASIYELQKLLIQHSLGLIIAIPSKGPSPAVLICLGTRIDEAPFTYPEVQRLKNVLELMNELLLHSKLLGERALEARIEYFAMASRGLAHDLKNLITPIKAWLLREEGKASAGSTETDVYKSARSAIHTMNDYIQHALDFSSHSGINARRANLKAVAATAIAISEKRATSAGINLHLESDISGEIRCDDTLLTRAISNVIENAVDATPAGGNITIRITESSKLVKLEIIDTGTGISPENTTRVFDPYYTTKRANANNPGFGLGLTIAQNIVILHKGRIELKSRPAWGTAVVITLPQAQ